MTTTNGVYVTFLLAVAFLIGGCRINPYDEAQRPVVRVQVGATAIITWTPGNAQKVVVFKGSKAGDSQYANNVVWWLSAADVNSIQSPVTYGATPSGASPGAVAKALESGETYTVWITRTDTKGSGDGFTNTRNKYEGTVTFVAR